MCRTKKMNVLNVFLSNYSKFINIKLNTPQITSTSLLILVSQPRPFKLDQLNLSVSPQVVQLVITVLWAAASRQNTLCLYMYDRPDIQIYDRSDVVQHSFGHLAPFWPGIRPFLFCNLPQRIVMSCHLGLWDMLEGCGCSLLKSIGFPIRRRPATPRTCTF